MPWGFGKSESTAKIVQKAIAREAKVVGSNLADTIHTVGDKAENTLSNAKISAQSATDALWSFFTTTFIPFVASFFKEPNLVLLGRSWMATMFIQGLLGFVPHLVSNKFNQSQLLFGLNVLAMAYLSFRSHPILAFQQIIPLTLLCCYGVYQSVGSFNIRKFQPVKGGNGSGLRQQNGSGVTSRMAKSLPTVLRKLAYWLKQAVFVFLVCVPIILAINKDVPLKSIPPSTTTWQTWFGPITLPSLDVTTWFAPAQSKYPIFHPRNLDWNNIVGGVIAIIGLASMVFTDIQHRRASKDKVVGDNLEPINNRQDYQNQVQKQRSAQFLKRILRLPSYLSELVFLFGLYLSCYNCLKGGEVLTVIPPMVFASLQSLLSILQLDMKKLPLQLKKSSMFQKLRDQSKVILPYVI